MTRRQSPIKSSFRDAAPREGRLFFVSAIPEKTEDEFVLPPVEGALV